MKGDWVLAKYYINSTQWTTQAQSVAPLRYCRLDQVKNVTPASVEKSERGHVVWFLNVLTGLHPLSSGACDQHVQQHWSCGGECVLQLGFPPAACPLPAVTRAHGQPRHGGEHAVPVLLEGPGYGALGFKVSTAVSLGLQHPLDRSILTGVARNVFLRLNVSFCMYF